MCLRTSHPVCAVLFACNITRHLYVCTSSPGTALGGREGRKEISEGEIWFECPEMSSLAPFRGRSAGWILGRLNRWVGIDRFSQAITRSSGSDIPACMRVGGRRDQLDGAPQRHCQCSALKPSPRESFHGLCCTRPKIWKPRAAVLGFGRKRKEGQTRPCTLGRTCAGAVGTRSNQYMPDNFG